MGFIRTRSYALLLPLLRVEDFVQAEDILFLVYAAGLEVFQLFVQLNVQPSHL